MKTSAIVRIILFTLAILILVGILAVGLLGNLFITNLDSFVDHSTLPLISDEMTSRGAVSASEVQNIDIEWVAGSITIEPVENATEITVQETVDNKYQMELAMDGNTLKIRYCKDSIRIMGINTIGSKNLIISVPADWICRNLDIEAASADVTVQNLTLNEVDFEGASGNCDFINCSIDRFEIETVSGDICVVGCVDRFNCNAVSANCRLELIHAPHSITTESVSGDLEILLPADCGFTCSKETVSGSFHTDFVCSSHDDTYIVGDGACQIEINGVSGDVDILINEAVMENHHCNH